MLDCPKTVIEELGLDVLPKSGAASSAQTAAFVEISPQARPVADILSKVEKLHIDELCAQTGLPPFRLSPLLLDMELDGVVESLPGKILWAYAGEQGHHIKNDRFFSLCYINFSIFYLIHRRVSAIKLFIMLIDKYVENARFICTSVSSYPVSAGFVAREEDSFESAEHGKYSPRSKKFVFNRSLRVNDGVLASYIAGMRDITLCRSAFRDKSCGRFLYFAVGKRRCGGNIRCRCHKSRRRTMDIRAVGSENFSREEYGLVSSVPSAESGDSQIPVKHEHISDQMSRMPRRPTTLK